MALSETKILRLQKAIDWSQLQLQRPRDERVSAVKQFVGKHYADSGAGKTVPVNFLKLAVDIYVRSLAARAPRVLISTAIPELKSTAANLELAINQIPAEIKLGPALRRLVTEALFSIGIVKVGLHTVGQALGHDYGEPFVDVITIDDYFCDMAAKRWDQIQFQGNDYWPLHEDVMESKWFKNKTGLHPDEDTTIGEHGERRASGVSINSTADVYKRRLWLRDVWLPKDKLVITYAVTTKRVLNTIEWDGPEYGPYHILGYSDVPGNLLPLPPVAVWRDLHDLGNALYRKLGKQADSQKSVLGFSGENDEEVEAFKKASDGDGIRYSGPTPETLTAGGIAQTTLAFFLQNRDLYSYFAGNLDVLGGLAPMTETVGQDKLLSEASGAQMRDMASKTIEVIRDIFRALAWYEWHDPLKERTLEKSIPGMPDMAIPVQWGPESREGDFNVYDLDIDVYSLMDDSPGLKLQRLGVIMQQYIGPLMPEIQRAGGQLDVQKLLNKVWKLSDMNEFKDIITFVEPDQTPGGQGEQAPAQDSTTVHERVSRPGATQRGKSDVLQRVLMGDQPQESEMAVLG